MVEERRKAIDDWFNVAWLAGLATCCLFTGYRLMQSAAWQRVLELTPGGRFTVVTIICLSALAALFCVAADTNLIWVPLYIAASWCFAIASFQLYSALNDPTGPLGFWAWFYVCWRLVGDGTARMGRFQL